MKTITKNKITRIWYEYKIDTISDLSWLGEFSDKSTEFSIKHEPENSRTYNFFNAANIENLEQAKQNYDRMMQFENGNVAMIGIIAHAEIIVNGTCQKISSCGLWGIESDSDKTYFHEVGKEQLEELYDILESLGFTKEEYLDHKPEVLENY